MDVTIPRSSFDAAKAEELSLIIKSLELPPEPRTKEEKARHNKWLKRLAADSHAEAEAYRLNSYKKCRCPSCGEVFLRNKENFFKDLKEPDGLCKRCISCERAKRRAYLERPGVLEGIRAKARERSKTPEARQRARAWSRRYLSKTENRIVFNLRCRLRAFFDFKRKGFSSGSVRGVVGCSRKDLVSHIESLWPMDGSMNWENYGKKAGRLTWHIDHIVPYAYFKKDFASKDLETIKRVSKIVNHFTNLQPLWGPENLKKNDTMPKWVLFNGTRMTSDLHEKVYGRDYRIDCDDI